MSTTGIAALCGTKLLIVDLDMCILDTRTLGEHVIDPVLRALSRLKLPESRRLEIERALWTISLQDVIEQYGIPEATARDMRNAYSELEVPDGISSFGDEAHLETLAQSKILVTSGFRRFQMSKIARLGIERLFTQIIVDAIDDPTKREGKKSIFARLQVEFGLSPLEVMIIGDSGSSELRAGKELDMITVQTLRPGIEKWRDADYHISSFAEL